MFLDEIGDLTTEAQARLLRFLNDRTYERLGEAKERRADVRILAATNRQLEVDVQAGRFREDLFYRLNVVALTMPPLRDRPEDIVPLAHHYLQGFAQKQRRSGLFFSPATQQALEAHDWPGNLRELRNAVERAVILASHERLEPSDLGLEEADCAPAVAAGSVSALGASVSLAAIEREHVARVIARAPSLEAAARTLGIDATTLQRKRKRFGLA